MASTHIAAVIVCAALRARPRPELTSANPAHARGAIRRQTMQSVVCISSQTVCRGQRDWRSLQFRSGLGAICERTTRTSPSASTPNPAITNPARAPSCLSIITAANTSIQPMTNRKKPAGFSGSDLLEGAAITVKIPQPAWHEFLLPMAAFRFARVTLCFLHRYKTLMTVIRKMSFTFEGIHWQDI